MKVLHRILRLHGKKLVLRGSRKSELFGAFSLVVVQSIARIAASASCAFLLH
ncbi:hypothetical protein [Symbiopectobacterium purcellii]|uniref:hypothetical protein n=1 Tax=Symbiopectobacterium purcellii TaxID=2871826 RepID=UPI003F82D30E